MLYISISNVLQNFEKYIESIISFKTFEHPNTRKYDESHVSWFVIISFLSFYFFSILFFLFFLSKVLSASSEDEVEVLVKLMQHNEDMAAGVLLDQQTILITDDESEAVFNFAAIATNADKLTIEVSKRSFLISPETKTTTRLCF